MGKIVFFGLLSCAILSAQDLRRWNANLGFGVSFPTGDAADRANTGFNFTGGAGYNFSKHFGIEADYVFNDFGLSDKSLLAAGAPNGYTHVWGFSANPVYRFAPDRKLGGYVLVSRVRDSLTNSLDLAEDEIGIGGPDEGLGIAI